MKKLFLFAALLVVFATPVVKAQWTSGANAAITATATKLDIYFAGTLDTLGQANAILISDPFSLTDYDGVPEIETSFLLSHVGNVKAKVTLLKSDNTTTAASMDATTILQDSLKVKTETFGFKALQGIRERWYRLKVESLVTGRKNQTFKIHIKSPKRDY